MNEIVQGDNGQPVGRLRRADVTKEIVYFVQNEHGYVKIGTTTNLRSRISDLSVGSAQELYLVREIPGGRATEKWLHKRYASLRVRGEWFRYCGTMETINPPDEIPVLPKFTVTRGATLTTRERVRDRHRLMIPINGLASTKLFALIGSLNQDEAKVVYDLVLDWAGVNSDGSR